MGSAKDCGWCGAVVGEGMMVNHRAWHRRIEPMLEEDTTPFGFWDENGRWNANSRDW